MAVKQFKLNVNGKDQTVTADEEMPLLYALRNDLGMSNPKFGCGLAQCGACTVQIDGTAVRSCQLPLSSVTGKITTLEGLGTPDKPHPLQTRLHQGAGAAVRPVHQRLDHDGRRAAGEEQEPDRRPDQGRADRHQVPLRDAHGHPARGEDRRCDDEVRGDTHHG